jgi:hypothetical protein
LHQKL